MPSGDLAAYHAKRDFARTAEPRGKKARAGGQGFIVQKHDASRLHYDFRLEIDGVLKSWAVPRGPSLDPADKRLAVQTEDHPLDYADFEGVIPAGEYGGGTVMLWDRGHYTPAPGKDLARTIEEGHLHFTLHGERMKGEWIMIRLPPKRGERQQAWLLKKVDDAHAGPAEALVERALTSVASGRTMAEIANGNNASKAKVAGAKKAAARPAFAPLQLASLVDTVPPGSQWLHEFKYDGYRLALATGAGGTRAYTRNGNDWTHRFAAIAAAADALPPGCLIDGEAVALDEEGKPDFGRLQRLLKDDGSAPLDFFAFDLLVERGHDLRALPNIERKARLAALLDGVGAPLHYAEHILGKGEQLLQAVCARGGEGIISKKASAPYAGRRGRHWLKVKCTNRQEFVIVGWTQSGAARGFRSLLLATREDGTLRYAGKVGTGFSQDGMAALRERLDRLATDTPPLDVPRDARSAHWVRPELVAEIAFAEFTASGTLRHASFLGLREDKPARAVKRERASPLRAGEAAAAPAPDPAGSRPPAGALAEALGQPISNPARVIFPDAGLTKGDLADYYARIAPIFLRDAGRRPMTLVRCPQGRGKQCFFQKHDSGGLGEAVHRVTIREKDGSSEEYLWFDDAPGVLACVQMGTIEFHGWGSRVKPLEKPDRLVFDLDPDEGLGFAAVKQAALHLRDLLADMGLATFPLLSGGKGLHVVAPLDAKASWPEVRDFAERFARAVAADRPELFTANIRKAQRKQRIFLDWLRNQRGATAVMPYSARAREGAPVAAPIDWSELDALESPARFTIRDADELLARAASPLLAGWGEAAQSLPDL